MKVLVLSFTIFASLLAAMSSYAAEIKIFDSVNFRGYRDVITNFQINRELGRAWVEIELTALSSDDMNDTYRQLVKGLSFDGNAIVLEHEGQLIECALVQRKGISIFKHDRIKNTNCQLKSKEVVVLRDNGFEIVKENHLQVFIVTK